MKKLLLAVMLVMLLVVPAQAEMFVYDSGSEVAVSWTHVEDAMYYEVWLQDYTDNTPTSSSLKTFDAQIVLEGLTKHNIYYVWAVAYDDDGQYIETIGGTFFCFAVGDSSNTCICNCPEIPSKVLYGVTGGNWATGVAICNSTPKYQVVMLQMGAMTKAINVPAYSCVTDLLRNLLGIEYLEQAESYPISITAENGVDVSLFITDGVGFGMQ